MGTLDFVFETEDFAKDGECAKIIVSIDVTGSEDEGGTIESYDIFDDTNNCSRVLEDFSPLERAALESKAQDLADSKAYDIWIDDCVMMAEYACEGDR